LIGYLGGFFGVKIAIAIATTEISGAYVLSEICVLQVKFRQAAFSGIMVEVAFMCPFVERYNCIFDQ
jgi:hypothetical protein